jgi:L-threonylcarbamoyladenylate synthase
VLTQSDAAAFERCMAVGGIAVFPSDTVYGLACDPDSREAVDRLHAMKERRPGKPSAVMFFSLDLAFAAIPELGPRTRSAAEGLLPDAVTLLVPNPQRRFPLACAPDPTALGVRVPALAPQAAALGAVNWPVLQSSANRSGAPDPRLMSEISDDIREAADLVLDAGELPGTPSTVVDLRDYEDAGTWRIVRQGALPEESVVAALAG